MPKFETREEYEKWKAEKIKSHAEKRRKLEEKEGLDPKHIQCYIMMMLMQLLAVGSFVIIVICLLPLIVPFIGNATSYKLINAALNIEKSLSSFVQGIIPTKIGGIDMTRWIIIAVSFFLIGWFNNQKVRFISKATKVKISSDYETLKEEINLPDDAAILAPVKKKLETLKTSSKADREALLKLFAETKKKLDTTGKDLSFLAIDVVDSTGMKEGEEKAIIEHDFIEYKKFVEDKLRSHGALKSVWTPDGVMICFPSVDAAVRTAREVIMGLDAFNKHVKSMKKDFMVRCGINSGFVYYDESLPLEEMSDRVIDIAGHMQKQAAPNNICIAKPAIEPMKESEGFVPASKVIDGYEVYIWGKK